MDSQTDLFDDLVSVEQFNIVPDPSREIIDKALMRIVMSPYSRAGDVIKSCELLCKKHGYLSPEKHELSGANGQPIQTMTLPADPIEASKAYQDFMKKK